MPTRSCRTDIAATGFPGKKPCQHAPRCVRDTGRGIGPEHAGAHRATIGAAEMSPRDIITTPPAFIEPAQRIDEIIIADVSPAVGVDMAVPDAQHHRRPVALRIGPCRVMHNEMGDRCITIPRIIGLRTAPAGPGDQVRLLTGTGRHAGRLPDSFDTRRRCGARIEEIDLHPFHHATPAETVGEDLHAVEPAARGQIDQFRTGLPFCLHGMPIHRDLGPGRPLRTVARGADPQSGIGGCQPVLIPSNRTGNERPAGCHVQSPGDDDLPGQGLSPGFDAGRRQGGDLMRLEAPLPLALGLSRKGDGEHPYKADDDPCHGDGLNFKRS